MTTPAEQGKEFPALDRMVDAGEDVLPTDWPAARVELRNIRELISACEEAKSDGYFLTNRMKRALAAIRAPETT